MPPGNSSVPPPWLMIRSIWRLSSRRVIERDHDRLGLLSDGDDLGRHRDPIAQGPVRTHLQRRRQWVCLTASDEEPQHVRLPLGGRLKLADLELDERLIGCREAEDDGTARVRPLRGRHGDRYDLFVARRGRVGGGGRRRLVLATVEDAGDREHDEEQQQGADSRDRDQSRLRPGEALERRGALALLGVRAAPASRSTVGSPGRRGSSAAGNLARNASASSVASWWSAGSSRRWRETSARPIGSAWPSR